MRFRLPETYGTIFPREHFIGRLIHDINGGARIDNDIYGLGFNLDFALRRLTFITGIVGLR